MLNGRNAPLWLRIGLIVCGALACSAETAISAGPAGDAKPATQVLPTGPAQEGRFVLIELFSSEGCSSCPPADATINRIAVEARAKKLPVYCLAYHVTYWDTLKTPHGVWKDPFSAEIFTDRQKLYSARMQGPNPHKGRLVTPQIIVNGRVATQKRGQSFADYIQTVLDIERPCRIEATIEPVHQTFRLRWNILNRPDGARLYVALTEVGIVSDVTAGENAGRKLPHDGLVRVFAEIKDPDTNKEWPLALPKETKPETARVVLFVQTPDDMTVHAATAIEIPRPQPGAASSHGPSPSADSLSD
jgi:hypothetical protein